MKQCLVCRGGDPCPDCLAEGRDDYKPQKYYRATEEDLKPIERVMERLYADMRRLNADDMRDLAQKLDGALRAIRAMSGEGL